MWKSLSSIVNSWQPTNRNWVVLSSKDLLLVALMVNQGLPRDSHGLRLHCRSSVMRTWAGSTHTKPLKTKRLPSSTNLTILRWLLLSEIEALTEHLPIRFYRHSQHRNKPQSNIIKNEVTTLRQLQNLKCHFSLSKWRWKSCTVGVSKVFQIPCRSRLKVAHGMVVKTMTCETRFHQKSWSAWSNCRKKIKSVINTWETSLIAWKSRI